MTKRFQAHVHFAGFAAAVLLVAASAFQILSASAVGEVVMGQVSYPDSSAVSGVQVQLHLPDGTISYTTSTDVSGNYSFSQSLTSGATWVLEVSAPTGYNKPTNSPTNFTYTSGDATRTVNFQLVGATKIISGVITYADGTPVGDADVEATPADANGTGTVSDRTDMNGAYSLNVQGGTYFVEPVANLSEQQVSWIYEGTPSEATFVDDQSSETQTFDFSVIRATGNLKVTLLNSDGNKLTTTNFVGDIDVRRADGIGTVRKVASADSSLNILLTPGIYRICAFHPDLSGKSFDPSETTFAITDNGTTNLGTVTAQNDSAHLKGTVKDSSGKGIANVQLMAFSETGCNRPVGSTDANGAFDVTTGAGTWTLGLNVTGGAAAGYSQASPVSATVANGKTVSGLAIVMRTFDRTVSGKVINSSGATITDFLGSAYVRTANNAMRVAAPVVDGEFTIKFSSKEVTGASLLLGVVADPGAGYVAKAEKKITVGGSALSQNVTVKAYDATISGAVLINGVAAANVGSDVNVYALDDEGNFVSTTVGGNGAYSLPVASGTWFVNYDIEDPENTNGLLDRPIGEDKVTVAAGKTVTKNLSIIKGTNTISGTVTDANNVAVQSARVTVDNRPGLENNADLNTNKVVTTTVETDANGAYSVKVPDGTYLVTAGDTPTVADTQLEPDGKTVKVSGSTTATANLKFEATNATISGVIKFKNKNEGGGTITAWTADGAQVTSAIASNGTFTLHVTSGEKWSLLATDISGGTLAASEASTITPKTGANTKNLTLTDTGDKVYGPVTKSFDATEPASVSLPDGTTVSLPSRALDMAGTVSLTVTPTIDLDPTTGDVAASLTYEVKATDADGYELKKLNAPATITMPYQQDDLGDKGLREKSLGTKFFNPETQVWEEAPGFVDTTTNSAKLITTHLTKFSVTGTSKAVMKATKASLKSTKGKDVTIQVTGSNFSGTVTAKIGVLAAKKVQVKNSTTLLITFNGTKVTAGKTDLTITNGNGRKVIKDDFLNLKKSGSVVIPK